MMAKQEENKAADNKAAENAAADKLKTAEKPASRTTTASLKDIQTEGNADAWVLISKTSSESGRFSKSTRAMQTNRGVIVQVSAKHYSASGQIQNSTDSLTFIEGAVIRTTGTGKNAVREIA